jgi:hypothetical protein
MKTQIQTVSKESPVTRRDRSVSMTGGKLHLGLVIDKSGSMDHLQGAVIKSVNSLVSKQRELSANAIVSFRTFNNQVDEVFANVPIAEVRPISSTDYYPTGGTALLDGIGSTIEGIWHAGGSRPGTPVVIAICSDGEENSSKECTKAQVQAQIVNKRFLHGWQFLFLSCDETAMKFALDIGIPKDCVIEFSADPKGLSAILDKFSQGLSAYRLGNKHALLQLKDKEVRR